MKYQTFSDVFLKNGFGFVLMILAVFFMGFIAWRILPWYWYMLWYSPPFP